MTRTLPHTPAGAVHAWWHAMQQQDLAGLELLMADDYVSSGGPAGRTTTREALLDQARDFFTDGTDIAEWSVDDLTEIMLGPDAAVCVYDWSESGRHAGHPFAMSGAATDVLVRRGGTWVHQAHHVSARMTADPGAP